MTNGNDTRKPVVVLDYTDPSEFVEKCDELVRLGYKLSSSNCGFMNLEAYNFCGCFQAIFVLPEVNVR